MSTQDNRRRPGWVYALLAVVIVCLAGISLVGLLTYSPAGIVGTASPQVSITPARDRPLAIFVGDSYTRGKGASSENRRWSSLVARDRKWDEVNFGLGGTGYATSANVNGCGQNYCPDYQESVAEVAKLQPDVVVVAGGQNDFPAFERNPAAVTKAVRGTLQDLRRALPATTLVVVGPSTTGRVDRTVLGLDAAVQKSAKQVQADYISLLEPRPVIRPAMVLDDRTHVNDAGHRAIATRVLRGLA